MFVQCSLARLIAVSSKVFSWADFYYRQRCYISNNFLQHLGTTEALTPFYNWDLLSYKMEHNYKSFNRNVYVKIFQRYFPALAKIPYEDHFPQDEKKRCSIARCAKTWAKQLYQRCVQKIISPSYQTIGSFLAPYLEWWG